VFAPTVIEDWMPLQASATSPGQFGKSLYQAIGRDKPKGTPIWGSVIASTSSWE
jgi:hypothetical protein